MAIVDRGHFGGTCVNTGCTPTKALIASAYALHMVRRGVEYGFSAGEITVDMKRVKARMDEVAGLSMRGVERSLKSLQNCTVYEGHVRFARPMRSRSAVRCCGRTRFFSMLGAAPRRPAFGPRQGHEVEVDAETKLILGATFLGTGGDEAIHYVLDIMYAKAPSRSLRRAVHIHPTVAEFHPDYARQSRTVVGIESRSPAERAGWSVPWHLSANGHKPNESRFGTR